MEAWFYRASSFYFFLLYSLVCIFLVCKRYFTLGWWPVWGKERERVCQRMSLTFNAQETPYLLFHFLSFIFLFHSSLLLWRYPRGMIIREGRLQFNGQGLIWPDIPLLVYQLWPSFGLTMVEWSFFLEHDLIHVLCPLGIFTPRFSRDFMSRISRWSMFP